MQQTKITALNLSQHGNEFNLLMRIFQGVLSNLDDPKYQNLNANRIHKKLEKCKICINLLHSAGFELSDNGKRLILNITKMDDLITIHEKLKALLTNSKSLQVPTVSTPKPLYIEKNGINTYEVLCAPSKQDAYNYLKSRTIMKELYYVIVETPDGNFGKDRMGDIFEEPSSSKKQLDPDLISSVIMMNLNKYIKSFNVLNLDINKSTSIQEFISQETVDNESYIVSDADEELLLLIEFEDAVHLNAIKFYSLISTQQNINNNDDLDISQPKLINIYKTENVNISFDDVESMKPDISIECTTKQLNSGQTVEMKSNSENSGQFKIKYLVIWIKSNINDTELTYLNSVIFEGNPPFHLNISDDNNMTQYPKLRKEFDLMKATTKDSRSKHLLKIDAFNERNNGQRCDLVNCQQFDRLSVRLLSYHIFIQQENNEEESKSDITMYDVCNEDYNITSLLDDFHHLLFNHDQQFEYIHNHLVKECIDQATCSLAKCVIATRHYSKGLERFYLNSDVIQERVEQEILDKIHCYYLHSFDIGYRLRGRDEQKLLDNEQKRDENHENDIEFDEISAIHSSCRNITGFDRIKRSNNKFKTDIDELVYDHGIRYFYWSYYKDKVEMDDVALMRGDGGNIDKGFQAANAGYSVKEWYIEKKYDNLKDEFLNNAICTISECGYTLLREESEQHHKTVYVKSMKSIGKDTYEIQHDVAVSVEHLIAMMAYCNKDVLQAKFSETFRRRENESDESMKQRHRNYHHFGRLLREFVECFGENGIGNKQVSAQPLWHGISTQTQFRTVMARLKGPVSATKSYSVAVNFSGNEGLILQFSLSNKWIIPKKEDEYGAMRYNSLCNRCAFLDCHWLSKYPAEQERFFIGGYGYFYFENIIVASSGENYQDYIQAIRLISETVQESQKFEVSSPIDVHANQIAFRLLLHELHKYYPNNKHYHLFTSIPPYIDRLFHNFCINTEILSFYHFIGYDYKINFDHAKIKRILQSMFFYDNGLMKLHIVAKVFPSLNELYIEQNCNGDEVYCKNLEMIGNDEFWILLLRFLKQRNKPRIVVDLRNVSHKQCEDMFRLKESKYGDLFRAIKWHPVLLNSSDSSGYYLVFTTHQYELSVQVANTHNCKEKKFVNELKMKKMLNFVDEILNQ